MDTKEAYQKKLEAKLDEWKAEIDKLKARAKGASADTRAQYSEQIEKLQSKREEGKQKLDELRRAGSESWGDLKSGIEKAWKEIEGAFQSAKSRFK